MKNKCRITIAGIELNLMSDYDPAYVATLAQKADEAVQPLLTKSNYSEVEAALLCLMDAMDEMEKKDAELLALKKELQSAKLDMEILKIEKEKLTGKKDG